MPNWKPASPPSRLENKRSWGKGEERVSVCYVFLAGWRSLRTAPLLVTVLGGPRPEIEGYPWRQPRTMSTSCKLRVQIHLGRREMGDPQLRGRLAGKGRERRGGLACAERRGGAHTQRPRGKKGRSSRLEQGRGDANTGPTSQRAKDGCSTGCLPLGLV